MNKPFGNHTAGNFADFGNVKDFANFGVTDNALFKLGGKLAFQDFLYFIGNIINDRVVANIHIVAFCHFPSAGTGTNIKADNHSVGNAGKRYIGFVDTAHSGVQYLHFYLVRANLFQSAAQSLDRALNIAFDDNGELLCFAGFNLGEHLLHGAASGFYLQRLALFALAIGGNAASFGFVFNHDKVITGVRCALQTKDFYRFGRKSLVLLFAALVNQSAHPTPFRAGYENVADL